MATTTEEVSTGGTYVAVVVVGIGAMGGGMARALLDDPSGVVQCVVGFDKSRTAVDAFFEEAKRKGKAGRDSPPRTLRDAVTLGPTDMVVVVILSLLDEGQCESVCFGGGGDDDSTNDNNHQEEDRCCLYDVLPDGSCIILTSTVTAGWAKRANDRFQRRGVHFCDCPVSGGPDRARRGDLTVMASGDDASLHVARPVLSVLGGPDGVHIVKGGAGAGSAAKCVHQLLAGIHIAAAAEALALAAKAGLDVDQICRIVNGAAGSSWMFQDRSPRMLSSDPPDVKSALNVFVKDLGIVLDESRRVQAPVPLASAALQQFVAGQSLGLGRQDDSQVVRVYEAITGTPVRGSSGGGAVAVAGGAARQDDDNNDEDEDVQ
jgi:3-hydroxyisobutyrate dehydrogenase-like beta-hydroxyacid dehydrogenase